MCSSDLVFRFLAVSAVLFATLCQSAAAQKSAFPYRDHVVHLLQKLLATGYPLDNDHDEGEWLQAAVNYAIKVGDREIESLAIRAAVPLRARVNQPVSTTDHPASIEVLSYEVLTLPRPVPYVAYFESSLDGGTFVDLGSQASGSPRTIELTRLGAGALRPGMHHVRLRARLVFGDQQQPVHSEYRELAPIAYAVYDPLGSPDADARRFIFNPVTFAANELDPSLPPEPFLQWLSNVLGSRGELADPRMWLSRYCSELTEEHQGAHDAGGICSVILFSYGGSIGQIWLRTGQVETSDADAVWYPAGRPSFEALLLSDGRAAARLSALPALLEQPYDPHPSDRTLSAPEIVITPASPKRGAAAKAVITLHNRGEVAVRNVMLEVVHLDGLTAGGIRRFVFDVPALGSQSVTLDVSFQHGYGLVLALPFIKDHGIVPDLVGAPLESPCNVRVVNAAAAPRDYVRTTVGHMSHCISR